VPTPLTVKVSPIPGRGAGDTSSETSPHDGFLSNLTVRMQVSPLRPVLGGFSPLRVFRVSFDGAWGFFLMTRGFPDQSDLPFVPFIRDVSPGCLPFQKSYRGAAYRIRSPSLLLLQLSFFSEL